MKTMDAKSVVVGFLFGVCAILALGAADGNGNNGEVGRYQIECPNANSTTCCFVIDTKTGQVWKRHAASSGSDYGSPEKWDR